MKILVIEDDDSQFEAYEDAAGDFSRGNDFEIELVRGISVDEAKQELSKNSFDGAIIDLNLSAEDHNEASGNDVLTVIQETRRFPIIVVSGNLGKLDPVHENNKSTLLQFHNRDTDNETIFGIIYDIYRTGITDTLGVWGGIENRLGDIFWKHLAADFDVWLGKDDQKDAFLRYTITHLLEYLDEPQKIGNSYYNEAEFYIKPPIRQYIATGDIAEKDGERFVVLSPACDVAVRDVKDGVPIINARRISLAKAIDINREQFIENKIIKESANGPSREKTLGDIVSGKNPKLLLLPEYKDLAPAVIDLQNLYSVEFTEYLKDYRRLATVSGPFLKDIQSNLSSYYGRQGQPDMDKKELVKKYKEKLAALEANQ